MSGKHPSGGGGRTEPTLGDLSNLDAPPAAPAPHDDDLPSLHLDEPPRRGGPPSAARPPKRASAHRGWVWPLLALLLIAALTLAWVNQGRLRGLLPRTQLNSMLDRADQALADGRLDGRRGDSARELFEAARALEPDNERANAGLRKVGEAELERARKAVAEGHAGDAEDALAEARSLLGGGSEVDAVAQALARSRQSRTHTDGLIEQGRQALADGRLRGENGAAGLFKQALSADPDNAVARHGLDKVGDALAAQAGQALDAGDLAQAAARIDDIADLMPGYGDLPALRARLAQAQKQADADVADHLQKGEDALRAGRFSGDGDDNALAQFRTVLDADPGNARAQAGLGQVAQALVLRANAAIDAGDPGQARTLLRQAATLAPHSADLAAARSRLGELRERDDAAAQQPALSDADKAKLSQLVARAQAAERAGDLMLPPGASAYDLYRAALAIDPDDADAMSGLQGLPDRATEQFEKALSAGRLGSAGDALATLQDLSPGDAAQADLRRRLADAWLDRAEHNLDAGDRAGAQSALEAARRLRPDAPRLQALSARVRGG